MLSPTLKTFVAVGLFLLAGGAVARAQPTSWSMGRGAWTVDREEGSPPPPDVAFPRGRRPCIEATRSFWQRCKHCLVDRFLGYPSEFEAPPLGLAVSQHVHAQVANGAAARMMLYDYDFVPCSDKLNPRGKGRLARMASLLSRYPFPLWIENNPRAPRLAEARRLEVLRELTACSLKVPPERVVVGRPLARPLTGEEALLIHQIRLIQTRSAGAQPGTGAGPFGGTGGFGPTSGFGPTQGSGTSSGGGTGVSGGTTSGTGGFQ